MAQGVSFLRGCRQRVVDVNVVGILRLGNGNTWHGPEGGGQELRIGLGSSVEGIDVLELQQADGGLEVGHTTDSGCGMTKILEAVRQLRGEAHPKVQVPNCDLAIAHGTGGLLGVRHAASTCILERV